MRTPAINGGNNQINNIFDVRSQEKQIHSPYATRKFQYFFT